MIEPTAPRLLTPGLTPRQTDRLREHLTRLTGRIDAASIYIDADRHAGRWMMSPHAADHAPAGCIIDAIAAEYTTTNRALVAYIIGFAQGIRIGRTFAPPAPPRAKQWISEEYRQLSVDGRRDAQRYIRQLLRGEMRGRQASPGGPARTARAHRYARENT